MAKLETFDITTGVDLQEVDNAVNQALKEIGQRFDFKGVRAEIDYDRKAATLSVTTTDEYKLDAIWEILRLKMIGRGVPVKNLHRGSVEKALGDNVRQEIGLRQGLGADVQRSITRLVKTAGLKRVQTQVQGDAVRVMGQSRDDLQAVIRLLKEQDYGVELRFGNYRS